MLMNTSITSHSYRIFAAGVRKMGEGGQRGQISFYKKDFIYLYFLQRGRERGREGEKRRLSVSGTRPD